jgi:hypothetical protein
MAENVLVGDVLRLQVEGRTASGQKAQLPAVPVWSSTPPGILVITPDAGALTVTATAVAPGECTVTLTCATLPPFVYALSISPGAATQMVVRKIP